MKQKTRNRILIWLFWVVWILCASSIAFGGSQNDWDSPVNWLINNTACISYVTQSWLTWYICDNASITYSGGGVIPWENQYLLIKSQKTWGMANYTQWEIKVESGEYISYMVEFACITWTCRQARVKDTLPNCVEYVSSSITWVTLSPTFSSWSNYIEYEGFGLSWNNTWYLFVTGQVITDTANCRDEYTYTNKWSFKCMRPSWDRMHSTVVAKRDVWNSEVVFDKTWNKYELYPGETWLIFTISVTNKWPNNISGVHIEDIWPGSNNCIEYSWWEWNTNNIQYMWDYKWQYIWGNWVLRAWKSFRFKIYANIKNDPSCTWSYINTWKLTYQEQWKPHELYDYYTFVVLPWYDVSITKSVDHPEVTHWTIIVYTIEYTNTWRKPLTNYTITDQWPNDKVIFSGSNPEPLSNNWNIITWYFDWPLAPWKSGIITITGEVR